MVKKKVNRPSYKKRVKDMCIQCMGTRENEGWMKLIGTCASLDCPLYDVRPYKIDKDKSLVTYS